MKGKNKLTFTQMIALDLQYCETMCLKVDTSIILMTIPAILGQLREADPKKAARIAKVERAKKVKVRQQYGTLSEVS